MKDSPLWAAAAAGGVAGVAGLAALLRSHDKISIRSFMGALLTSFSTGVIVFLLLAPYVVDIWLRVGVSALAGAGGSATMDVLVAGLQRYAKSKFPAIEKDEEE